VEVALIVMETTAADERWRFGREPSTGSEGEISRGLKIPCPQAQVPIIALKTLSRNSTKETTGDKRHTVRPT